MPDISMCDKFEDFVQVFASDTNLAPVEGDA